MSKHIDLTNPVRAWHFTAKPDQFRDGRKIPPVGTWLVMGGAITICKRGLHFSRNSIDAIRYAPGPYAHLVEVAGIGVEHSDKGVASARRIVASCDAEDVLRECARKFALRVIKNWDAPEVVVRWLKTGDCSIQSAAHSAAYSAARSAAYYAADSAAYSAVDSAAYSAADYAADSAARSAADPAVREKELEAQKKILTQALLKKMGMAG